jgi:hypothetical protein
LKLALLENTGAGGTINHLGVEVADADPVDAQQSRLVQAGHASIDVRGTTSCYAKQDKVIPEALQRLSNLLADQAGMEVHR